jgi:hypothetical protein
VTSHEQALTRSSLLVEMISLFLITGISPQRRVLPRLPPPPLSLRGQRLLRDSDLDRENPAVSGGFWVRGFGKPKRRRRVWGSIDGSEILCTRADQPFEEEYGDRQIRGGPTWGIARLLLSTRGSRCYPSFCASLLSSDRVGALGQSIELRRAPTDPPTSRDSTSRLAPVRGAIRIAASLRC